MEVRYGAAVFHAILAGLQDDRLAQQEFDVRDDGVWLKPFRPDRPWHPWDEMLERGSPNPDEKPLLPLPWFNARELAAFLMDGSGKHLVGMNFGVWVTGSEDWARSCSRLAPKAKEAMLDAYAAFRAAADSADHLLPEEVKRLAAEHAQAKSTLRQFEAQQGADLESEEYAELLGHEYQSEIRLSNAYATDSEGRRQWQKAIVRQLLATTLQAMVDERASHVAELDTGAEPTTKSRVHTSAKRRNHLDPIIALAKKNSTDASDRVAVWNALTALALRDPKFPLIGFADNEVRYHKGDAVGVLTKEAFNKRWHRKVKEAGSRR